MEAVAGSNANGGGYGGGLEWGERGRRATWMRLCWAPFPPPPPAPPGAHFCSLALTGTRPLDTTLHTYAANAHCHALAHQTPLPTPTPHAAKTHSPSGRPWRGAPHLNTPPHSHRPMQPTCTSTQSPTKHPALLPLPHAANWSAEAATAARDGGLGPNPNPDPDPNPYPNPTLTPPCSQLVLRGGHRSARRGGRDPRANGGRHIRAARGRGAAVRTRG